MPPFLGICVLEDAPESVVAGDGCAASDPTARKRTELWNQLPAGGGSDRFLNVPARS